MKLTIRPPRTRQKNQPGYEKLNSRILSSQPYGTLPRRCHPLSFFSQLNGRPQNGPRLANPALGRCSLLLHPRKRPSRALCSALLRLLRCPASFAQPSLIDPASRHSASRSSLMRPRRKSLSLALRWRQCLAAVRLPLLRGGPRPSLCRHLASLPPSRCAVLAAAVRLLPRPAAPSSACSLSLAVQSGSLALAWPAVLARSAAPPLSPSPFRPLLVSHSRSPPLQGRSLARTRVTRLLTSPGRRWTRSGRCRRTAAAACSPARGKGKGHG